MKLVYLCGAAFWRYVITSTGNQWSLLALVLSQDLVLFVHSMDLQPFAQVLSQDLVQNDLTLQSSQNGGHAGSY